MGRIICITNLISHFNLPLSMIFLNKDSREKVKGWDRTTVPWSGLWNGQYSMIIDHWSNLIITMIVYTCVVVHIYHCQFSLTDFVIIIIFLFIIIFSTVNVRSTKQWWNGTTGNPSSRSMLWTPLNVTLREYHSSMRLIMICVMCISCSVWGWWWLANDANEESHNDPIKIMMKLTDVARIL